MWWLPSHFPRNAKTIFGCNPRFYWVKVFFSSDECPYFNHYQKYVHKYYCLLLRLVGQGGGVVDGIRKRACVDWSNVSVPPRCYQGVAITRMQHGEQRVTPLLRLCPILSLQLEHSFTPGRGGREWGGCYQGWKQSLDYEIFFQCNLLPPWPNW